MSTPASKKRKLNGQPKYYAVRAGHTPGVYQTWEECQANTSGFKGAVYKSFISRDEATAFANGRAYTSGSKLAEPKFYGVANGHKPGVYTDWSDAQEQIMGFKGPKYKKFATKKEALEFVKSGGEGWGAKKVVVDTKEVEEEDKTGEEEEEVQDKRHKGKAAVDEYEFVIEEKPEKVSKLKKTVVAPGSRDRKVMKDDGKGPLLIYTDGSSLGNGRLGAAAGVGVFFGTNDPRNVSEPLLGTPQTNQRAELTAIFRALEISPLTRAVTIFTDSKYSIDCVTNWFRTWEKNAWMTAQKKPVMNKDLVQGIVARIREREGKGGKTRFEWIKGHSEDPGNEAADRLAVAGARRA